MMVTPVDQCDADRSARKPKRRFQSAEAGADDHDAMGFWRSCLLGGHVLRLRFQVSPYVGLCKHLDIRVQGRFPDCTIAEAYCDRSGSAGEIGGVCAAATRPPAGSHAPASAPSNDSAAATLIAAAQPPLNPAGELAAPVAENTVTSSAIPNMPPRKRA